jgi:hypothetical protein
MTGNAVGASAGRGTAMEPADDRPDNRS